MNNKFIEAHELIAKAREALRRGDKASARQMGERAARLAPTLEDVWLVLTAADPDPQDSLAYAKKALQINPHSARAQRAVDWATNRGKQVEALKTLTPVSPLPRRTDVVTQKQRAYQTAVAMPTLRRGGRSWLLPLLLVGGAALFFGFIALFVIVSNYSPLTSMVSRIGLPAATQEKLWAPAEIAKPEVTPRNANAFAVQAKNTPVPTSAPTQPPVATKTPTSAPTQEPTDVPTDAPTALPLPTETPGGVAMQIIEDTPTSEYQPPKPAEAVGNGDRWIDVDLTNQMVYAYEGDVIVNSFLVSTGTWLTPTITGEFKIYVKYRSAPMHGPGYYLPNVPYVMYFYKSYGLHGTYWHNNFGTPMSHGCVNLRTDDAAWLFDWASVGTVVNVHY